MERRKQLGLGIAALMLGIAPVLMAEPAGNAPAQPPPPPPAAVQDEVRPQCPMMPQGPQDGQGGRAMMGRMGQMGPMGRMMMMQRFGAGMPQPGKENCPMMGAMRMPSGDRKDGRDEGRGSHRREMGLTPKAPMSEDDIARFADLNAKLRNAVVDFRAAGNDQTRAAVKTALDNLVAANQAFEIDRCEKALARAKAKVQEKDEIVSRALNRLTAQPKCDDDDAPKAGPAKCPKGDKE